MLIVPSSGLVANSMPCGMPAAAHRSASDVQEFGRYSSASTSTRPREVTTERNTPNWQLSIFLVAPVYWC